MSYYRDNHNTLYCQDFRQNDLPDELVQMVCTSPPYWGLRKYAGEQELIWGGNKNCEHKWGERLSAHHPGQVQDNKAVTKENAVGQNAGSGHICALCGAWKGAYGLEPTPEMYVRHTIEILREIRRVLRKDGVVFFNIGDSYASGKGTCFNPGGGSKSLEGHAKLKEQSAYPLNRGNKSTLEASNLKPKDLCLIPFKVAIAAQEDGWWVRSVIIWSKPNPMPESVTDRPTNSHEYILMLTKSKKYYWDADAVREVANYDGRHDTIMKPSGKYSDRNIRNEGNAQSAHTRGAERWPNLVNGQRGRNIRSVWEFPTQPYPEAHFAVFPEKLPEICIKAATPEVGCCSKCGSPWERIVEKGEIGERKQRANTLNVIPGRDKISRLNSVDMETIPKTTIGWQPTCKCNADKVPSIVLDPFAGAGTTLWVAKKLNRKAIGYEISEEYCKLIVDRCRQQGLL